MKRTINVMYFKDSTGKINTLEFSITSLKLLIAAISILIFVALISTIFSIKLYFDRDRLTKDFVSLTVEKEALEGKLKGLETTIKPEATSRSAIDSTVKSQTSRKDFLEVKPVAKNEDVTNREEIKDIEHISLQGFQAKNTNDNSQLIISFDIVKEDTSGATVNGYVLIVGDYGGTYFCFPEDAGIKDGAPLDFKKGSRFSIKWHKRMEYTLPYSMNNPINKVITFVYSANGNLLIKKEVDL